MIRSTRAAAATLALAIAAMSHAGGEALTGDWCGNRDWLDCRGVSFDLDVAHFYQGVASGGAERRFRYGGHGDYVTNFDFGKMGAQEGLFLKLRAEHRFGESIGADAGTFFPPAVLADLPVADSEELLLTNVLFTQFVSPTTAVFFGKLDTLDGDLNAFAHGRGKTQFLNTAMVANPIALRTIPYSTLGLGFTILGEEGTPLFTYTLLNATDTAETDGFSELFAEGVAMSAELRVPTRFAGLPGHQLFAATWSSRDFASLDQDPRVLLPSVPINETDGSWSVYYNFDQHLRADPCQPGRGWGVFGRAGVADDQSNPVAWFLSLGVGGNNPHRGRGADTFGAGWFVSGTSDEVAPFIETVLGPLEDGHGVELFYNWQAAPWLAVTPDLQVLVPARDNIDTAVLVGLRAVMRL